MRPPIPQLPYLKPWFRLAWLDDAVVLEYAHRSVTFEGAAALRLLRVATPWLPVLPFDGRVAVLGPLYVPGESCCYECYRLRRAANSPFPGEFWALERGRAAYPSSPALDAI